MSEQIPEYTGPANSTHKMNDHRPGFCPMRRGRSFAGESGSRVCDLVTCRRAWGKGAKGAPRPPVSTGGGGDSGEWGLPTESSVSRGGVAGDVDREGLAFSPGGRAALI